MFREFDDGHKGLDLSSEVSTTAISQFIKAHRYPMVCVFDQEAANRIFGEQLKSMFYFDDDLNSEGANTFKEFGKKYHGKDGIVFCVSTIKEGLG